MPEIVDLACSACGRRTKAPIEYADRKAKCPACGPRRALSHAEAERLLAQATPRFRLILETLLGTGIRKGELCGLQWRDVDLKRRRMTVRPETAKTGRGRVVPLTVYLVNTLSEVREGLPLGRRAPKAPVFASPSGHPYPANNTHFMRALRATVRRANRKAIEEAKASGSGVAWTEEMKAEAISEHGIPPVGVDLHALRYTYGSWLIEAGANVRAVAELLGHRDPAMTLRVYADAAVMDLGAAVDRLPQLHVTSTAQQSG